jgi:uncharacterized OsmC-like protein
MSVTARCGRNLQVEIQTNDHQLLADEPVEGGGDNMGPGPYDLLLSALAACKVMTVLMYARRKQWPVEAVNVTLNHNKIHARDCEDCETSGSAKIDLIDTEISFEGDLNDTQIARLADISARCPVHRTLISETKIRTRILS